MFMTTELYNSYLVADDFRAEKIILPNATYLLEVIVTSRRVSILYVHSPAVCNVKRDN